MSGVEAGQEIVFCTLHMPVDMLILGRLGVAIDEAAEELGYETLIKVRSGVPSIVLRKLP